MQGVIAAVPTPVDDRYAPVEELFKEHCAWALDNGCNGLNVLGSTGEANSLDLSARRKVMAWAMAACPPERLMVGTGTPSLNETIALTTHADDLGYRIALVLPPYYYKPANAEGLTAWYTALHEALGPRPIQIYFYNFPQMTGISIPVEVIGRLAARAPVRFTGIKDSSGDRGYARSLVVENPGLRVFPSSETLLHLAVAEGYAGCISASVNITAPLAAQVWAARAYPPQEICERIDHQRDALAGPSLVSRIKYLVANRTGDLRWRRVLPPFVDLTEEEGQRLLPVFAA